MTITLHAAQRFVERVIGKAEYTKQDLQLAIKYLDKTLKNVVPNSVARSFALPGFESQFCVVYKNNTIITIIPKRDQIK